MSDTERVRMVEVLHRELGRMVDPRYLADALIAEGFGDVTALNVSPRDRVTIASLIADLHRLTAERDALAAKVAAVEAQPIVAYGVHPPDGCVYVPWVNPKDDYRTAGEKTHAQKSVDRNQGRGGVWSVVPLIERASQEST